MSLKKRLPAIGLGANFIQLIKTLYDKRIKRFRQLQLGPRDY